MPKKESKGFMIPSALKSFFTELISRGQQVYQEMRIRALIRDLLTLKIREQSFAYQIAKLLNSPLPSELIDNLTKQMKRVPRPTTQSKAPDSAVVPRAVEAQQTVTVLPLQDAEVPSAKRRRPIEESSRDSGFFSSASTRDLTSPAPLAIPHSALTPALKLFFEDIKRSVNQGAEEEKVEQCITELLAGDITPVNFLTKIGALVGTAPPDGLTKILQEEIRQAHSNVESMTNDNPVQEQDDVTHKHRTPN